MKARTLLAALLASLALAPGLARAAGEPLQVQAKALMVLKVLAYDRELPRRASGAVLVAVAALPDDAVGLMRRDALVAALRAVAKDTRARGLPVEARAVTWDAGAEQALSRAAALVVVGKLEERADAVGRITRARRILSIGEDPAAVERGLAVAIFARDARPVISASLVTARQEGAAFEPSFLRQAELLEYAAP